MEEFDLEKLTTAMPYKAPKKEFFENFSSDLIQKIEHNKRKRMYLMRSMVAAAVVACGLILGVNSFESKQQNANSLDKFLVSLSDEDLNSLIADCEYVDEFYENL
ncbi:MAG: hypothetical protein R3Y38_01270 [Rikenellaceae bacterium]